jgi:hypothetical protein
MTGCAHRLQIRCRKGKTAAGQAVYRQGMSRFFARDHSQSGGTLLNCSAKEQR